jgi:hypothetical protein
LPWANNGKRHRAISGGLAWIGGVCSAEKHPFDSYRTGSSAPDAWWIASAVEVKDDDCRSGGPSNLIAGTGAATTWLTAACWCDLVWLLFSISNFLW